MLRFVPLCLLACGPPPVAATFAWEVDDTRFRGDTDPSWVEVFTVAAADLDDDGDDDVLLNRHHLVRSEVFENVDGELVQLNPRGADTSGFWDNPGIPEVFATEDAMDDAIAGAGVSGLVVWHDEARGGWWHLRAVGAAQPVRLRMNTAVEGVSGVPQDAGSWPDPHTWDVEVPADGELGLRTAFVATQLVVSQRVPASGGCFVGPQLSRVDCATFELWKPDPHGVAWVDAFGGPEPELFVTRGGLTGILEPPLDPKQDLLFSWSGARFDDLSGLVPRDYGRGRQVSWIDVDHDGDAELFVACTGTPDRLLDRGPDGRFVDVAPAWGLDSVEPESFAWVDVDGDGLLDLVQNQTESLEVLLRRGDHFEARDGASFGLVAPVPPSGEVVAVFNPFTVQGLDHDRDGDLDVWVSAFGEEQEVAVFANEGGAFRDVTGELGLTKALGFGSLVSADVDRDGWVDVVSLSGTGNRLWHNEAGARFAPEPVPSTLIDGVATDVDGDGRTDLVGLGADGSRRVIFDRHTDGGSLVTVTVDAPLGSRVVGRYADGSEQAFVFGGWTSRYSQTAGPLRFGSGHGGDRLVDVVAQAPGGEPGEPVDVDGRERLTVRAR